MKVQTLKTFTILLMILFAGCATETTQEDDTMKAKLEQFEEVTLSTDLSWLSDSEREILSLLIDVADIMDEIYWTQTYGDKNELLSGIDNEYAKKFAMIHYGPWDRMDDNAPFIEGVGVKPPMVQFYPQDLTVEEFEEWEKISVQRLRKNLLKEENE